MAKKTIYFGWAHSLITKKVVVLKF